VCKLGPIAYLEFVEKMGKGKTDKQHLLYPGNDEEGPGMDAKISYLTKA